MEGRLSRFKHFNNEFESQISKHATYREAYEATEEIFRNTFGYQQYSSWPSFKTVRSRILRKSTLHGDRGGK